MGLIPDPAWFSSLGKNVDLVGETSLECWPGVLGKRVWALDVVEKQNPWLGKFGSVRWETRDVFAETATHVINPCERGVAKHEPRVKAYG